MVFRRQGAVWIVQLRPSNLSVLSPPVIAFTLSHALGQVALIFGPDDVIPAIPYLQDAENDSSPAVKKEAASTFSYIPVGPASIGSYWDTLQ
jgi:hypothetical protein